MKRPIALALLVALVAAVSPALADPGPRLYDPSTQAERLLDEGRKLFADDADYVAALDRFRRSYELVPSWQALNGIALVHQQQGLYVDALETYERMLSEWGPSLTTEQKERAQRRIAWLRARVSSIEVVATQKGARVEVDGDDLGLAPLRRTIRVLPGRHTVLATLDAHEPCTRPLILAAGANVTVEITLRRTMILVEKAHLERPLPAWTPWIPIGAGVIAAAAGGVLVWSGQRDYNTVDDTLRADFGPGPFPVDFTASRALYDRAQAKNTAGISLAAAGTAAIVGGILFSLWNHPRTRLEKDRVPRVVEVPGGLGLGLEVAF